MEQPGNTPPTVTIPVNEVDENAVPTGRVTWVTLTIAQLGDILSHALQTCTAQRAGCDTDAIIDELGEALGAGGIF